MTTKMRDMTMPPKSDRRRFVKESKKLVSTASTTNAAATSNYSCECSTE
jgi:hypothetical protein